MNYPLEIYYGVATQSLAFVAPQGRPSSITSSQVFENADTDDATAESALSGSAAVDTSPNTTVDAASGPSSANPRKVNLTATTGIVVGGLYLVTGTNSESEWVEVTEIAAADFVLAKNPLHNDYVNTNTFVTTRVTHALSDTWTAAEENISGETLRPGPRYRWRIVYVVSSVTYVADLYFDLVRYKQRADVVPVTVEKLFPGFLDAIDTYDRDTQGRATIEAARHMVDLEAYHLGLRDEDLRDSRTYTRLVAYAANAVIHQSAFYRGGTGQLQYEQSRRDLDEQLRKLVVSGRTPTDSSTGGAGVAGERKPLLVR